MLRKTIPDAGTQLNMVKTGTLGLVTFTTRPKEKGHHSQSVMNHSGLLVPTTRSTSGWWWRRESGKMLPRARSIHVVPVKFSCRRTSRTLLYSPLAHSILGSLMVWASPEPSFWASILPSPPSPTISPSFSGPATVGTSSSSAWSLFSLLRFRGCLSTSPFSNGLQFLLSPA